jgi:hypothetical protein
MDDISRNSDSSLQSRLPRRRRWLRYAVRAGLALAILIVAGIGWLAMRAARQRGAVEAILKGGGSVGYDYPLVNWRSSWWDTTPGLIQSAHDMLDENYFGNAVHAYVKTNAGLEQVKNLSSLKSLNLDSDDSNANDHHITDAGLERLKDLTRLESLWIWGNGVSDDGLRVLAGMGQLKSLDLMDSQITDIGLAHLKGLRELQHLGLHGANVSDAGLQHLKGLSQLQSLTLSDTKVSDAGLDNLKGLAQLRWLDLGNTQVTDEGLQMLKHALPICKITP